MPQRDEIVAQFPIGDGDRFLVAVTSTRRGPLVHLITARPRADGELPATGPRLTFPARYARQVLAALGCAEAMLAAAVPIPEPTERTS